MFSTLFWNYAVFYHKIKMTEVQYELMIWYGLFKKVSSSCTWYYKKSAIEEIEDIALFSPGHTML